MTFQWGYRALGLLLFALCLQSQAVPPATPLLPNTGPGQLPSHVQSLNGDQVFSEWPIVIHPARDRALYYRARQPPAYLRASGIQLATLLGGFGWYHWKRESNSLDWEYNYEWSTLEAKLDGTGYSFDTNIFDTNALSHSGAGTLYYLGARSSRLGPLASLGTAFASSALWEVIVEYRERVSLNDMMVTPLSGAAVGESLFQLGSFFDRSCETPLNSVLGALLSPMKAYGDAVDGAVPFRATRCDENGFTGVGEHRFDVAIGPRLVQPLQPDSAPPYPVGELRVQTDLVNLRRYGQPGHDWTSFSDGNLSALEVVTAFHSSGLEDLRVSAQTTLFGLHHRHIYPDKTGRDVVFGTGVATEYGRHRYSGENERLDPALVVGFPALMSRLRWRMSDSELEVSIMAAPTYAAIGMFALPSYEPEFGRTELTTVAQLHGYSHAFGVTLAPRVSWRTAHFQAGLEARNDRLSAVRSFDGRGEHYSEVDVTETRGRGRAWLLLGPRRGMNFRLDAEAYNRRGEIDGVSRRRSELRLGAAMSGSF